MTECIEGVRVSIKLQPRASRDAFVEVLDGQIKIALKAPPVDQAANQSLEKFVAKSLGVSKGLVTLVSGEKSRNKVVQIRTITVEAVLGILEGLIP